MIVTGSGDGRWVKCENSEVSVAHIPVQLTNSLTSSSAPCSVSGQSGEDENPLSSSHGETCVCQGCREILSPSCPKGPFSLCWLKGKLFQESRAAQCMDAFWAVHLNNETVEWLFSSGTEMLPIFRGVNNFVCMLSFCYNKVLCTFCYLNGLMLLSR